MRSGQSYSPKRDLVKVMRRSHTPLRLHYFCGVPILGIFFGLGSQPLTMAQPDTVELAQFREQWKSEVQSRKRSSAAAAEVSEPPRLHSAVLLGTQKAPNSERLHVSAVVPSQNLLSALQIYRDAIQREQNGELDDALLLYRQAFRMVFLITYSTLLVNLKIR